MTKKLLKPSKEDLVVINPQTNLKLRKEGEIVVMCTYWKRRIKCGDVIEVKEAKAEPKKKTSKKTTKNIKSEE